MPRPLQPRLTAMLLSLLVSTLVACAAPQKDGLRLTGAQVLSEDGNSWRAVSVELQAGKIERVASTGEGSSALELDLQGLFLVPGLIDLHTHLLLHPYDETLWTDQVLRESLELRTIRAVAQARATLEAGFTTIRELGTEGAAFADVALRDAIAQGIVPGPRILTATRALVASGCYGPSGFDPRWEVPKGAEEADGVVGVRVAVRRQIAAGADWIKFYADYRRAPGDAITATFTLEEIEAIVDEARSAGRPVAAHATSDEGARRAALAGVQTIEHGTAIGDETLRLMRERGVVLVPTLAASEAVARYAGWDGQEPVPARVTTGDDTLRRAHALGVAIACGSDAGVFSHGDNAREIELLAVLLGSPAAALRAATGDAARVLGRADDLGRIAPGFVADLVAVGADPLDDPSALRRVVLVIQDGRVVVDRREPR